MFTTFNIQLVFFPFSPEWVPFFVLFLFRSKGEEIEKKKKKSEMDNFMDHTIFWDNNGWVLITLFYVGQSLVQTPRYIVQPIRMCLQMFNL